MPKTVGDVLSTFGSHHHNNQGEVVIHFEHAFHILSEKEHEELEEAVSKKLMLVENGMDELDPLHKLAIWMLAQSY